MKNQVYTTALAFAENRRTVNENFIGSSMIIAYRKRIVDRCKIYTELIKIDVRHICYEWLKSGERSLGSSLSWVTDVLSSFLRVG